MASKKVKGLRITIWHLEQDLIKAQRSTKAEQKASTALAEMVGQYRLNLKEANRRRHAVTAERDALTQKIDELRLRNNTMHQRAQAAESRAIKAERSMDKLSERHTFWQRHHPSTPRKDEAEASPSADNAQLSPNADNDAPAATTPTPPVEPVWPELGA